MDTRVEDKPIVKPGEPAEPAPAPAPTRQLGRGLLPFRAVTAGISLSPLNRRRWHNFKANRRGYWSLWLFLGLFLFSLFAEVIANDKPIVAYYKGEVLFPVFVDYPEAKFGGFLAVTDYKDKVILDELSEHGWAIWPPISYSYRSINKDYPRVKNATGQCLGFPGPPPWATRAGLCDAPAGQVARLDGGAARRAVRNASRRCPAGSIPVEQPAARAFHGA